MTQFKTTLDIEKYKTLINLLTIASSYVDDLDIKSGVIRQATPDKVTCLKMDLSHLIKEDLCIPDIKSKLTIFDLFIDDTTKEVTISSDDKMCFISSTKSDYHFTLASPNRIKTTFIDDAKFQDRFIADTTNEKLVYDIDMIARDDVHKKIKKICDTFNSDKIILSIDDKKLTMNIESFDKKSKACVLKADNSTNIEKQVIVVRSNFIDKLDTKNLKKIAFYGSSSFNADISVTKADCDAEGTPFEIYTFSKCMK